MQAANASNHMPRIKAWQRTANQESRRRMLEGWGTLAQKWTNGTQLKESTGVAL